MLLLRVVQSASQPVPKSICHSSNRSETRFIAISQEHSTCTKRGLWALLQTSSHYVRKSDINRGRRTGRDTRQSQSLTWGMGTRDHNLGSNRQLPRCGERVVHREVDFTQNTVFASFVKDWFSTDNFPSMVSNKLDRGLKNHSLLSLIVFGK